MRPAQHGQFDKLELTRLIRQERVAVALEPHSEQPDLSLPEDYREHHPDEHPTDWGWHGEWGRVTNIAGVIVAIILVLLSTATHYNLSGLVWLWLIAAGILGGVAYNINRRRNAWRR